MLVTEVVPRTLDAFDPDSDAGRTELRGRYALAAAEFVRLNMITSLTGAAAGSDGTSDSLTSRVDRAILGVIRAEADVVLVGAQSVRAEGYVVPRSARLAIVTSSGDLSGHRLNPAQGGREDQVLVLCPASRIDEVRARAAGPGRVVVPVEGADRLAPAAILEALRERGLGRVVCEGGPTLASQFAAADLVDEYCVTVAPGIEPSRHPFLAVERSASTEVAGMLVDEAAFSYLRLRRR